MPFGWDDELKTHSNPATDLSLPCSSSDGGRDAIVDYDQGSGLTDEQRRGINHALEIIAQHETTESYAHELGLTDEQRRGVSHALAQRRSTMHPIEDHGHLLAKQRKDALPAGPSPDTEDQFHARGHHSSSLMEPSPTLEKQLAGRACDQCKASHVRCDQSLLCGSCQDGGNGDKCAYTEQVSDLARKRRLIEELGGQMDGTPTRLRERKRPSALPLETAVRRNTYGLGHGDPVNAMIYDLRAALDESSTWSRIAAAVNQKFPGRGRHGQPLTMNACISRFTLKAERIALGRSEPYNPEWYMGSRERSITLSRMASQKRFVDRAKKGLSGPISHKVSKKSGDQRKKRPSVQQGLASGESHDSTYGSECTATTGDEDTFLRQERDYLSEEVQALEAARKAASSAWGQQISLLEQALSEHASDTANGSIIGGEDSIGAAVDGMGFEATSDGVMRSVRTTASHVISVSAPQPGSTLPAGILEDVTLLYQRLDAHLQSTQLKCTQEHNVVLQDQCEEEIQVLRCSLRRFQGLLSTLSTI